MAAEFNAAMLVQAMADEDVQKSMEDVDLDSIEVGKCKTDLRWDSWE